MTPSVGSFVAMNSSMDAPDIVRRSAVYTAPAIISSAQTVTITAKSSADPTVTASAVIHLVPLVPVSISVSMPEQPLDRYDRILHSVSQSLTAAVTGSTNTGVTWSLSPNVGSLAMAGNTAVYAAPAIVEAHARRLRLRRQVWQTLRRRQPQF